MMGECVSIVLASLVGAPLMRSHLLSFVPPPWHCLYVDNVNNDNEVWCKLYAVLELCSTGVKVALHI